MLDILRCRHVPLVLHHMRNLSVKSAIPDFVFHDLGPSLPNRTSISSMVLPAVSGYVKKFRIADPRHSTVKMMMKIWYLILRSAGGMNKPSAKLNSQFPTAAIDIPTACVSTVVNSKLPLRRRYVKRSA
jgi:hypothetical protein